MLNCRLDVEKNCTGQCIPHAGNVHVFFFPNQLFNPNKGPGDSNAIIIIIQSLLSVTVKHCYHFENTIFGYSMATLLANEINPTGLEYVTVNLHVIEVHHYFGSL